MTTTQPQTTHRIVVGVDGSPSSVAALAWAAGQAGVTGAVIDAVTTWEWPRSYGVALTLPSDFDPEADARKVLDGALADPRRAHPGVPFRSAVVEGQAETALVEASRGADLLVVGSRGHGGFTGMLLGSVSEHCVANAHCPVVVVRDLG